MLKDIDYDPQIQELHHIVITPVRDNFWSSIGSEGKYTVCCIKHPQWGPHEGTLDKLQELADEHKAESSIGVPYEEAMKELEWEL